MSRRRLVISVMGPEGHGKTDLALTARRPMLVFGIDPNTEAVLEKKFKVDKVSEIDPEDATYVHCPMPMIGFDDDEERSRDDAWDSWCILTDQIRDLVDDRLKVRPRSVIFDNGTSLNELNTIAEFGRTNKIAPAQRKYKMGDVNNRFKGLFRACEVAGVDVIVTHRVKAHYEKVIVRTRGGKEERDEPVPGVYDRVGFREVGNLVNTEVLAMFDSTIEGKLSSRFGMRVTRCMLRPGIIGREYWGREDGVRLASIPYLATLLYPQTSIEDWE